jgi:glutaredoxin 3
MTNVEIYAKDYCPYCKSAKALLQKRGVKFTEYDVLVDAEKYEEMLRRSNGGRTVPQIFIDDVLIGGSDDLHALDRSGQLAILLKEAAA